MVICNWRTISNSCSFNSTTLGFTTSSYCPFRISSTSTNLIFLWSLSCVIPRQICDSLLSLSSSSSNCLSCSLFSTFLPHPPALRVCSFPFPLDPYVLIPQLLFRLKPVDASCLVFGVVGQVWNAGVLGSSQGLQGSLQGRHCPEQCIVSTFFEEYIVKETDTAFWSGVLTRRWGLLGLWTLHFAASLAPTFHLHLHFLWILWESETSARTSGGFLAGSSNSEATLFMAACSCSWWRALGEGKWRCTKCRRIPQVETACKLLAALLPRGQELQRNPWKP